MANNSKSGDKGNLWFTSAWVIVTALILLTPLIAMRFTTEVNWTVSDFAFAGAMLVGSGIIYELAARAGNLAYQAGVVLALAASVLIMWTTGAVGIIGSEANPGNLVYVGLVPLAILGAIIARGRAPQMAWAMFVVAVGQVLVPVIAFASLANPKSEALQPEVFVATGVLAALWLGSAWFFRKSTRH